MPLRMSWGCPPSPSGIFSISWEQSIWRQLAEMPQKASPLWSIFPNSFFLIWVEQLGLLVPVEVRLAAPCDSWQAGKVHLCKVASGDQVAKQECASRACWSPSLWRGCPPGEEGKAGEWEVLTLNSIQGLSLLTLISLFWPQSLWLMPT